MRNWVYAGHAVAILGLAVAGCSAARGPQAGGPAPSSREPERAAMAPLPAQEAELRAALAPTAAVVVSSPGALELWYPVRLAFAPDSTELLPAGTAMLDLVAHSLRSYRHTTVVVAIYTDAIGSSESNQGQSELRAAVLVDALKSRGVAPARLIARGLGESAQLEAPNTAEGRDLNRRVQLVITRAEVQGS